jgi:hypothetical protein
MGAFVRTTEAFVRTTKAFARTARLKARTARSLIGTVGFGAVDDRRLVDATGDGRGKARVFVETKGNLPRSTRRLPRRPK